MENVLQITVDMELTGRMTQLPDSQKIFGALMYCLAESNSPERAGEFVKWVKKGEGCFTLSDMLPQSCYPVPQVYLTEQIGSGNNSKEVYKEIKKRQFVPKAQLQEIMDEPSKAKDIYPYIKIQDSQKIHAAIESLRLDLPGLDPNVYSIPESYVLKVDNKECEEKPCPVKSFQFHMTVKKEDKSRELLQSFYEARDSKRLFFLGPRASQGLNTFFIKEISTQEHRADLRQGWCLNMGMLLPDRINVQKSYIKLFTSRRFPYNREGGWDKNEVKKFISFIQAGSIVWVSEGRKNAGRSLTSPFDDNAIVFGNAFLLPVSVKEAANEQI